MVADMAVWQRLKKAFAPPNRTRMLVFAVVVALIGGVYLRFAFLRYESAAKQEAIVLAQSLEALIHPEHIAQLTGAKEDLANPDYMMIKTGLMNLVEITNPIRFAYL
jgi:hypothetical protein